MLDSSLIRGFILFYSVPGALLLYGSYWAFTIRKALVARVYRVQALWVGVIGVYFAGLLYAAEFIQVAGLAAGNFDQLGAALVIFFFLLFVGFVLVFAWVDATVRVARKSDPLARDTLHWSRLRFVLWVPIAPLLIAVPSVLYETYPVLGALGLLLILVLSAFLIPGATALLLSGRRSKDPTLRKHLKWFGLFVASGYSVGVGELLFVGFLFFALFVPPYFLYRSARSLAQFSRLPPANAQSAAVRMT